MLNIYGFSRDRNKVIGFINKMFIRLLTSLVHGSNHSKCIYVNNHQCMIYPTLINLHPNEYCHGLHYYHFTVNLDRYGGSCKTINDQSNRVCVPNEIEDLKLSFFFNMITGINKQKI